jgi:predicted transposase YdaD
MFDNLCKLLSEKYPLDFARWLLPEEPRTIAVLKTELIIEPIRADFVTFLRTENRILHLDFHTEVTTSETSIPFDMLECYSRLMCRYEIPITQVAFFLQETSHEDAFTEAYESETTNHRYQVIRMWEQDSALFLNNPVLLPLAPLTRTNSPQNLLSQVAENIAKIEDNDIKRDITAYSRILASLRFQQDFICQFLSEDIVKESAIYQDILQKGEARGEVRGQVRTIMRLLSRRLGEIDSSLVEQIKILTIEKLDALTEALLEFSEVTDLVTWLNRHKNLPSYLLRR